jgi:hypothetical protein
MIKFLDFLNEESELQGGLHSRNPMKARKAAGELRAEMRNKIPASHAERLIGKYSNHPKLATELRNAKEKYPEADVRPILKTHIKQMGIKHMGV